MPIPFSRASPHTVIDGHGQGSPFKSVLTLDADRCCTAAGGGEVQEVPVGA